MLIEFWEEFIGRILENIFNYRFKLKLLTPASKVTN